MMVPPISPSRATLLAGAGIAAFLLAFQAARVGSDSSVVEPVVQRRASPTDPLIASRTAPRRPDAARSTGLPGRAAIVEAVTRDPFAPIDWGAPPPAAPTAIGTAGVGAAPRAAATPAPPDAVPLRFIGRIERRAGPPVAFLMKGEMLFMVHVGDVIEHTYRVDAFDAGKVIVTEMPRMQRRTIPIAGT